MRVASLFVVGMILVGNGVAEADLFQWEDERGGVHFTDSFDKVPKKYRSRARQREVQMQPVGQSSATSPTATDQPAPPAPPVVQPLSSYDGWQARFSDLRQLLNAARERLAVKKVETQRAHRAYVISLDTTRIKDDDGKENDEKKPKRYSLNTIGAKRKAYYDLLDETKALEAQISSLEAQLLTLQGEADAAGVPAEYR